MAIAPKQPAVIDHANALTFEELRRSSIDTATRLDELGVRAGDRVMTVSENCAAAAVLLLAMSRLDAWAIIVNPRLSPTGAGANPRAQRRALGSVRLRSVS
nr:AMP-binding protein [Bradyrhizobium japonicum]